MAKLTEKSGGPATHSDGPPAPPSGGHVSPHDPEPRLVPDESDDPDYPDNVEGTGSERDDEPSLDEPIER